MNDDLEPAVRETRELLGEQPPPDLSPAVMRGIEHLEPRRARREPRFLRDLLVFLWTPREVAIRPVLAVAGVMAVVLLAAAGYRSRATEAVPVAAGQPAPAVFVQFRLEAMASRVQLAGSFTNWEPRYELMEAVPGIWSITVPLTQGVHDYAFVVDGQRWVADPYAPQIGDGFGGINNRLSVLTPDTPQL